MRPGLAVLAVLVAALLDAPTAMAQPAPLTLEAKIPLGAVRGRIDHMAVDTDRQLLFIAELGNDSVGIVDLKAGTVARRLSGLREPQGVGWHGPTGTLYVANAGDGSVRLFQAPDFHAIGQIPLGDDADNVRLDGRRERIVVGYGKGALAVIDPKSRTKLADIRLKAHPESFQIDESGARAFVNVPDAQTIEVVDLAKGEVIGSMPTQGHRSNFPMAIDRDSNRVLTVFRNPPRLLVLSTTDNTVVADLDTCGDADDVFVDPKRHRIYVTCGAGAIDVIETREGRYTHVVKVPTAPGARTGLFVPERDRLYLAVRAAGSEAPAIWVFRPTP